MRDELLADFCEEWEELDQWEGFGLATPDRCGQAAGQARRRTVRGRPRQTMLNRAMSAVYYSMFHALCRSNANALIGASSRRVHQPAWARAHRALDHGFAREHLKEHRAILPATAQNFRIAFRVLRENRHRADYGPEARFSQDEVVNLIDWAEAAIQALFAINAAERRALVAVVLLRGR